MGWSLVRVALAAAAVMPFLANAAAAQHRRVEIVDGRGDHAGVVRHHHACGDCGLVARYRAGEWRYVVPQPPRADYGQALPIYQPPIHAHPGEVVPVYPLYPRSGAYPVRGAPGRPPLMAPRPYYPSGSDARVITLNDRPVRSNRRRR